MKHFVKECLWFALGMLAAAPCALAVGILFRAETNDPMVIYAVQGWLLVSGILATMGVDYIRLLNASDVVTITVEIEEQKP